MDRRAFSFGAASMSETRDNESVDIPKWMARAVVGGMFGALTGAAFWAHAVAKDVSSIKVELRSANEMRATELGDVRRRLDRIEAILDRREPSKTSTAGGE